MSFSPLRLTVTTADGDRSLLEVPSIADWKVGDRYLWQSQAGESENTLMRGFQAEQPLTDAEWRALDLHTFEGMDWSRVFDVLSNSGTEIILKQAFGKGILMVTVSDTGAILDITVQQPN